jgi:hypothetical protein
MIGPKRRWSTTPGSAMSVEAFTWALSVPVGGNAKVVLLGLANHAHPDGSESYPALDTLAGYAHCDRSTARRNVRKLAADGWIVEDGTGPKGQAKYRLAMGVAERHPVAKPAARGGTSALGGVAPVPPEPSREPSKEPCSAERARARTQRLPDDFPDELKPHARRAFAILRDVAEQYNAREVTPRGVGLAIMGHQGRRFVQTAYELASWAQAPNREIRDVVATYRTFLGRADVCAGLERFDVAPVAASAAPNVHHIRPGETRFDRAQESLRVLHDQLVAEGR